MLAVMPYMKLPFELCIDIIEFIYYDPQGLVDYATLSACSQVCLSWTEPSQKLLFRWIDLTQDEFRRYRSLMAQISLSNARGKTLGSYIRVLDVSIGVVSSPQFGLRQHEFTRLILFCPHLYHLTLRSTLHKFDNDTMTVLQTIASPGNGVHIRALYLSKCGRQSPILYQFISVWPGIQFLRLAGRISAPPPPKPSRLQLRALVLSRGEEVPSNTLDWLLSNSEKSLQVLELWDEPGPRMKSLVARHGAHLRSLRMPSFNKAAAEVVRLCPKLEELALVIYHSSALAPLCDLPSSIEHLAFRNMGKRSLNRPIINAIKTLPNLRVLTCDQGSQQQGDFTALQSACNIRTVDLRVDRRSLWIVSNLNFLARMLLILDQDTHDPVLPHYLPCFESVSDFPILVSDHLLSRV